MDGQPAYPKVSVIIVNYNGGEFLTRCIDSVVHQCYPDLEIILVDNGSIDGSAEQVESDCNSVKVIRAGKNLGFSAANNLGARYAAGEMLAFINPDALLDRHCLDELVQALKRDPSIGLATAKILLYSRPDKINTCGNEVHFTGMPSCRGWMLDSQAVAHPEEVVSVSGAAFMARRSVFDWVGGFDESFFLYAEDTDLSWRVQLMGYRCVCAPGAIVYHRYEPRFEPAKFYYLERNRCQMLLKNLHWRSLALLIPALMLTELVTWGYAFLHGKEYRRCKMRTYSWLVSHRKDILAARAFVQRSRVMPDKRFLGKCSFRLNFDLASPGLAASLARLLFDPLYFLFFRAYLALARW
jgi:hypothetical protein